MGDILVWLVTAVVGFFAGRDTAKVPLKKVPVAVAHLPGRAASHLVSQVGTTLLQLVEHIVFGVGLLAIVAALVLIAWRHRPGRARLAAQASLKIIQRQVEPLPADDEVAVRVDQRVAALVV